MPETQSASNGFIGKGFFGKLANGDFGLAQTYWIYMVLVSFVVNIILNFVTSIGVYFIFLIAFAAYWLTAAMGTWNAANKYKGNIVWPILAKTAVVFGAIMLVVSLFTAFSLISYT